MQKCVGVLGDPDGSLKGAIFSRTPVVEREATRAGDMADVGHEWCGDQKDWPDLNRLGVAICTHPAGHDGNHEDFYAGVWWPPQEEAS